MAVTLQHVGNVAKLVTAAVGISGTAAGVVSWLTTIHNDTSATRVAADADRRRSGARRPVHHPLAPGMRMTSPMSRARTRGETR